MSVIFDTCCGCIELRVGCLIIGYLHLVFAVINALMLAIAGLVVAANSDQIKDALAKQTDVDTQTAVAAVSVVAVILLVLFLIHLIMSIVFVVGLHQNKRGHVKAYLIYSVVFMVLYALVFFSYFGKSPIPWVDVVTTLISILLSIYFLLVIRSHYYKMNDSSRQPAIYNTA